MATGLRLALIAILLTACGQELVRETVTVEIPVPVKDAPPETLLQPIDIELPEFIHPDHPDATSALNAAGEKRLRQMLLRFDARIRAWRAWAEQPID